MRIRGSECGFSLLEVIVAAGIFAGAAIGMLALLPELGRQGGVSSGILAAGRLPDAIHAELARLAWADFDGLASEVPVLSPSPASGFALVAMRDVSRVQSRDYLPPATAIPDDEQYFLVECWRFAGEPLRFDGGKNFLALEIRVSWPYRLPGTVVTTAPADRSGMVFVVSLRR